MIVETPRPEPTVPARRRFRWLAAVLVVAVVACSGPPPESSSLPPEPGGAMTVEEPASPTLQPALRPGEPRSRTLGEDQLHRYPLEIPPGHFARLTAEQRGGDVRLSIVGPDGEESASVDSPTGAWGPETVLVVSDAGGLHHVEVACAGTAGEYELRLDELRPADATDRRRATAHAELEAARRASRDPERREEGLAALHRLHAELLELGDLRQAGIALETAGWGYRDSGRRREAVEAFAGAIDCYAADDPSLKRNRLAMANQRAVFLGLLGDARDARQALEPFLAEAEDSGHPDLLCAVLATRSDQELRDGRFHQALAANRRALQVAREEGLVDAEVRALARMVRIHTDLDELQEADDAARQARRLLVEHPDRVRHADTHLASLLIDHGEVRRRRGDPEAARRDLEEAGRLLRSLDDPGRLLTVLSTLGQWYLDAGALEAAERHFREAGELARQVGIPREEALMQHKLGRVLFAAGRPADALALHELAARRLAELDDEQTAVSAAYGVARCLHALGRHWEAKEALEALLQRAEGLRAHARRPALKASWVSGRSHYWELYVDVLAHLHEADPRGGFDLLALAAAEHWKARNLVETLRQAGAEVGDGTDPGAGGDPGTGGDPAAVERLREEHLADGDLALVYALGGERSLLWAVTWDSLELHVLPARSELEMLAGELLKRLRQPSAADEPSLHRHAADLASRLLEPVKDSLESRRSDGRLRYPRLVVVADGALLRIPFSVLQVPGGGAGAGQHDPLVRHREVVHLPSLTSLAELRDLHRDRRPAERTLAILADPVLQSDDPRLPAQPGTPGVAAVPSERVLRAGLGDLQRLPGTLREAAALQGLLEDPDDLFAAVGLEANREVVLEGRLRGHRIVHFATHGIVDRERPELSALALSAFHPDGRPREDGFLWMHELYALDLPAELVVLSACETGDGREYRGEGLVGLARGFMSAGTPRLVVSLWQVDDEATAMLMYLFYRNLLQSNLAPADALRQAQRSFLEDPSGRWSHPYYWAGFLFMGDWATRASLADPDDSIAEAETGAADEPPPPRTPEDLPIPDSPGSLLTRGRTPGGAGR